MSGEHDDDGGPWPLHARPADARGGGDDDGAEADARDRQRAAREAMDRLNDSNRLLVEARMLPRDKSLTAEQVAGVVTAFAAYAAERKVSMAAVAREVGFAPSVVSEWAAGRYRGNLDAVTHAVNDWMERDARRNQHRRPKDYVRTWVAEDVRTYAYLADKRGMMAAIVVPSGAGKTKVLKALTAEMRGVYVYCRENVTARDLYRAIATALGWQVQGGGSGDLLRYIVEQLDGTHRPVFVDEAQNAGKHIGCLRSIHDQTGVPIVMAGTDEILRHVNDRAHGRGQLSSRCIRYNAMDHVHNAEGPDGGEVGRDLFTVEEIQAFFAMKKIRVDRDALRLLWSLACLPNYGTLRLVENVLDTVAHAYAGLDVVTREHVVFGLQSLVGGEATALQRLARRHADASGAMDRRATTRAAG